MIKPELVTGHFSLGDFEAQRQLCSRLDPHATIVEIGCQFGRSTSGWADNLPQGTVWAIDHWGTPKAPMPFDSMLALESLPWSREEIPTNRFGVFKYFTHTRSNILPLLAVSPLTPELRAHIVDPISLVFIDTDHSRSGTTRDITYWYQQVESEGWITGHDYSQDFPDVVEVVNEWCATHNCTLELFKDSTIWAFKKP